MEGKFFCTNDFFSISQMTRNRKGQKLRFLNQMTLSFSHIEKHVLTSHVGKVMKLLFFEDNNRAISETQTVFWFCFYCFVSFVSIIIRATWDIEKLELCYRNVDIEIFGVNVITILAGHSSPVSFLLLFPQPLIPHPVTSKRKKY